MYYIFDKQTGIPFTWKKFRTFPEALEALEKRPFPEELGIDKCENF